MCYRRESTEGRCDHQHQHIKVQLPQLEIGHSISKLGLLFVPVCSEHEFSPVNSIATSGWIEGDVRNTRQRSLAVLQRQANGLGAMLGRGTAPADDVMKVDRPTRPTHL
jgi:hypothetical protein